jgi:hypothetical protein
LFAALALVLHGSGGGGIESGKAAVIADGIESNDLCVAQNGNLYVTDPPHKQVWLITPKGEKRVVDTNDKGGIAFPNGVSPVLRARENPVIVTVTIQAA